MTEDTRNPILFVDVDGVISVFGFSADAGKLPGPFHWIDGVAHCIPLDVGGRNTQSVCLFVDDADAHCANARAHGAVISSEPATHDYGDDYWSDRSYECVDPGGHHWWFAQRVRDPK